MCIYTNSFTKEEVEILALAITKKLNILTKVVHDRNHQQMITISKSQLPLLRELVKAFMHPSMYYKLGLKQVSLDDSDNSFNYKDIPKLKQFNSDCYNYEDIFVTKGSKQLFILIAEQVLIGNFCSDNTYGSIDEDIV